MKGFITLTLALISFGAFSCDVCGGVSAPGTQGLLASNKFHFIGIKQSYSSFRSNHDTHSSLGTSTSEYFLRSSVVGKWQFAKRFNALVELPYIMNFQNGSSLRSENGIGDINLWCNYLAVDIKEEDGSPKHALRIGLGIKAPTGEYSDDAWETSNLFPGSGSYDALLTTNYTFRKKKIGFLQENNISFNGENKYGYRYGSSIFTRNSIFFNKKMNKSRQLIPVAGISYLYTGTDHIQGIQVAQLFNSGHVLNGELSLNLLTSKWMFNLKTSYPIFQYIGNGDVTSKGTYELSIIYLIQKK